MVNLYCLKLIKREIIITKVPKLWNEKTRVEMEKRGYTFDEYGYAKKSE